jgi:hypothetical protein
MRDLGWSIGKTNALFVATLPYPPGVRKFDWHSKVTQVRPVRLQKLHYQTSPT